MAYDLEEQEQIANFKAFWNRFGNLISWVLILACGAYAAYNFWNSHERDLSREASNRYVLLTEALDAKDNAKVQRIAGEVEKEYGRSAYAPMAALAAAKSAFDANDLKTAKAQLQWAIDHGNDEYKSVARLRLSGVLLDEKAYDGALAALNGDFLPQFAAEVADRRGDVLVAQNKLADARTAYQNALDKMGKQHPGRQIVQVKLDAIGGAPVNPAVTVTQKAAA